MSIYRFTEFTNAKNYWRGTEHWQCLFRLHCSRPQKVILQLILIQYCMDGSYRTCFEFIRFNNTVLGTDQMALDLTWTCGKRLETWLELAPQRLETRLGLPKNGLWTPRLACGVYSKRTQFLEQQVPDVLSYFWHIIFDKQHPRPCIFLHLLCAATTLPCNEFIILDRVLKFDQNLGARFNMFWQDMKHYRNNIQSTLDITN